MTDNKEKKKEKQAKSAMEVAADYLTSRMRTVHEMRQHLKDKGFGEDEIDETVNDLIGLRYLDDYAFALRYYEYNTSKHRGSQRAVRELQEKGVDSETIKFALEDYLYEYKVDEFAMALEIAQKEEFDIVDDRLIAKVARKLENRGFSHNDIYRVMSEMRRWNNRELN